MCVKESWQFSFILFMWFICSAPNIETLSTQKIQIYILMMLSCFFHNTRTSHNSRDRVSDREPTESFGLLMLSHSSLLFRVCACVCCVLGNTWSRSMSSLLHIAPSCPKSGTGGLINANTWGWNKPEPETHQDFDTSLRMRMQTNQLKIDLSLRRENSGLRRPYRRHYAWQDMGEISLN